jgi:two-component sensor histidine kinase
MHGGTQRKTILLVEDNATTLGLQLVATLVQQVRGTVELRRSPAPAFTIRFPVT